MTDNAPASDSLPPESLALTHDVDPRLLEVLICPLTRGPLDYDRDRGELVSRNARLAYPVRDGVPIMLVEEARALDEAE